MRSATAAVLVGILALAGCTAQPPSDDYDLSHLQTSDEDMARLADCLDERGWPVVLEEGAIGVELTEEQKPAYDADTEECLTEIGIDTGAALTEEDYQAIYAWHTDISECLEGAGWSVPETPSYEVFRSTYDTDPWIPWSQVEGPDFERATAACPMLNGDR